MCRVRCYSSAGKLSKVSAEEFFGQVDKAERWLATRPKIANLIFAERVLHEGAGK